VVGDPDNFAVSMFVTTNMLRCVVFAIRFRYPSFKLTDHDSLRIKKTVDKMESNGKIIRLDKRERHWIGVTKIVSIIDALFADPLQRCVPADWAYMIGRITGIIPFAATGARVGDIRQRDRYFGNEFS